MFRQWARNFYRSALSTITPMAIRARSRPLELGRSLWKEGNGARRIVGYWLVGASGLVFGIVVLGGLTRLTESGLSMVDWSLLHFRPPRTEAEWQAYFEKYQQFPEYQLNNRGMSLDDFKRIYWYEHAHRVYGRLLGMYVLLPSAFFIARGWVSPAMRRVLLGCSSLVIFQVRPRTHPRSCRVGPVGLVHGQKRPASRNHAEWRACACFTIPACSTPGVGLCSLLDQPFSWHTHSFHFGSLDDDSPILCKKHPPVQIDGAWRSRLYAFDSPFR